MDQSMNSDTLVELRYGRGHLGLTVPSSPPPAIIRKPPMPVLASPADAVKEALNNPIGCLSLCQQAERSESACILICDITRPVPNHLFLRPLIEELLKGGLTTDQICILVATGLHRPNEGSELEELIGDPWVLENISVENNFATRDADHVFVGKTDTRGTVVRLNRRLVNADLRIATGLVEPHFMAGYSGGRKVIAPGVAHHETIRTFHSARFMNDSATTSCNFIGNPLHEEQLEIIRLLGGAMAVNTVLDEDRQLSHINFGEIIASHAEAVDFVRGYCEIDCDRQYQTVVTSAAGYPLDKTYYQTIKGMVCAMQILKPGGNLLIVSEISEGFGSNEFREAQRRLVAGGPQAFLDDILQKPFADIDEWQTQMQTKPMFCGQIHLITSGLSDEEASITGVQVQSDLQSTFNKCLDSSADRSVAVIPEGPYVIPMYRHSAHVA